MPNEPDERTERRKRGRWLAAGVIGLGLIAVACRHDGSGEWATGSVRGDGMSAEGGGEHGGGEGSQGGGEHGGGEGSEEDGEEASPSIPIDQEASGNFNLLDYAIGYDPATKAFRGVVENRTGQTVCAVRVEAHVAMNGRVIEFGPTPGVDLAAGETLDLVLPADLISPDAYAVHPESSPCP